MKRRISIVLTVLMIFTAIPFNSIAVFADENNIDIEADGASDDDVEISDDDIEDSDDLDTSKKESDDDKEISDDEIDSKEDDISDDITSDDTESDNDVSENYVVSSDEVIDSNGNSESDNDIDELVFPTGGALPMKGTSVVISDDDIKYDAEAIYDELNEDGVVTDKEIEEYFKDLYIEDMGYSDDDIESLGSAAYDCSWDIYSNNYVYNLLPDRKKVAWMAMDLSCRELLEGQDNASMTDYVGANGAFSGEQDLKDFTSIFRYSHPQYYFIKSSYRYYTDGSAFAYELYPDMQDGDARKACTEEVIENLDRFIGMINDSPDAEEKIRSIHDTICSTVSYNHLVLEGDNDITTAEENKWYTQSAYSALKFNYTVCAGYTMLCEMLYNYFDVDCIGLNAPGHAWNMVRVYDSWYCMDTTWDSQSSGIYYKHFLKSRSRFTSDGTSHRPHSYWEDYLPKCTQDSAASGWTYGWIDSPSDTVRNPVISVTKVADNYNVSISTPTSDADIYYTINGDEPASSYTRSTKYTGGFSVPDYNVIKAIAVKDTMFDSDVVESRRADKYTITYFLNGGVNDSGNPDSYTYAATGSVELKNPTKDGFAFSGWYTTSDFNPGSKVTEIDKSSAEDIKLYAKWGGMSYSVVFDGNGATGSMSSIGADSSSAILLPACTFVHSNDNKYFLSWNTQSDGNGTEYIAGTRRKFAPSKEGDVITLYAIWKDRFAYTSAGVITAYNGNETDVTVPATINGTAIKEIGENAFYHNMEIESVTISEGITSIGALAFYACMNMQTINMPNSLKSVGNQALNSCHSLETVDFPDNVTTISSWALYNCSSLIEVDLPLKLKSAPYGLVGACDNIEKLYIHHYMTSGTAADLFKDCTIKGTIYGVAGSYAQKLASDAGWSFVAITDPVIYSVKFNANGGSGTVADMDNIAEDRIIVLPNGGFTRTGYTFKEWNTAADGSGDKYLGGESVSHLSSVADAIVNLYAIWEPISVTVDFDVNGGNALPVEDRSKNVTYGQVYGTLPTPTRSRYTFVGWAFEDENGTLITADLTMLTAYRHTAVAVWEKNPCVITFDPNGGSLINNRAEINLNEQYTDLPSPNRSGYEFMGWYDAKTQGNEINEGDTHSVDDDVTFYARWMDESRYGGMPAITGVTITADTAHHCNNISWDATDLPKLAGYSVYGVESDNTKTSLGFTESTSFKDTQSKHFKYYIINPCVYSSDDSFIKQSSSDNRELAEIELATPSSITLTQYGDTKMHISWIGDANADSYEIYFTNDRGVKTKIGTVVASCSYDDMSFSSRCNLNGKNGSYSIKAIASKKDGKGLGYSIQSSDGTTPTQGFWARDLSISKVIVDACVANGLPLTPAVTVYSYYGTSGFERLVDSSYYEVSYSNNISPGTGTVTITAKEIGPYYGSTSEEFEILDAPTDIVYDQTNNQFRVSNEKEMKAYVQIVNGQGTNGINYVIKDTSGNNYNLTYQCNMKLMNNLNLDGGVLDILTAGKTIVIDLNGKTLSTSKGTAGLGGLFIINSTDVTFRNGSLNCIANKSAIYANDDSTITLDAVTLTDPDNEGITINGADTNVIVKNNSTITAGDIAIRNYNNASIDIKDSEINSTKNHAIHSNNSKSSIVIDNSNINSHTSIPVYSSDSSIKTAIWASGALTVKNGSNVSGFNCGINSSGELSVMDSVIEAKACRIIDSEKRAVAIQYTGSTKTVSIADSVLKVTASEPSAKAYGIYCLDNSSYDPAKKVVACLDVNQSFNNLADNVEIDSNSTNVPGDNVIVGPAEIRIKYELNGGTNSPLNPERALTTDPIVTLNSATKTGYTFGGWYTKSDFSDASITTIDPSDGQGYTRHLYAKWITKTYTLHIDVNGGDHAISDRTITYNESIWGSESMPIPTRAGYSFMGWYTEQLSDDTDPDDSVAIGSAVLVNSGDIVDTDYAGDVTLYALWKTGGLKVSFDSMGGSHEDDIEIAYGDKYSEIGLPEPEKARYIFDGWYTSPTAGSRITENDVFEEFSDITLYAHWTAIGFEESTYYVVIGKKINVKLNVNDSASFLTSNKKTATVTATGTVKGIKKGKVKITATHDGQKYTCTVQVVKKPTLKGVKTLKIKKSAKFKVKDGGGDIVWSSSKPSVATVDKNGKVIALAKGSTNIIAVRNGVKMKIKLKVTK